MITLFRYNWQVRDEWFDWCKQFSHEDFIQARTGGLGSILERQLQCVFRESCCGFSLNGAGSWAPIAGSDLNNARSHQSVAS